MKFFLTSSGSGSYSWGSWPTGTILCSSILSPAIFFDICEDGVGDPLSLYRMRTWKKSLCYKPVNQIRGATKRAKTEVSFFMFFSLYEI